MGRYKEQGQAMVEYMVVLAALITALLMVGQGAVGLSQDDKGSVLKAVADKHRGQGYALSLSELPETDDMVALADYYDSLGKYPELAKQLKQGGEALNQATSIVNQINDLLKDFKPVWENPFKATDLKPDLGPFK